MKCLIIDQVIYQQQMYTRLLNFADDDDDASEYGGVSMIFAEKWIRKIISVAWIKSRLTSIKTLSTNLVL